MKIVLTTPEPPTDNAGNETTSARWRRIFEDLGHDVQVVYTYRSEEYGADSEPDAMVALHAYKSDASIRAFEQTHPDRPLVVALTGTDLYRYRHEHPEVDANIERADALVALQDEALEELSPEVRERTHVVYQSVGLVDDVAETAEMPGGRASGDGFDVAVAAHLRDVKDPLRTAEAARRLDASSTVTVTHVGQALEESWESRARREHRENDRYLWLGEIPRPEALALIRDSDLLAVTSVLEGGPNVISEAIALGTPVVASRISGNVGLLGDDYPGYFEPEDEAELAELLHRAESDPAFYEKLERHCDELRATFEPERERRAWERVFEGL